MIQYIEHKDGKFYMNIHNVECYLHKINLYTNGLAPHKRADKPSTIGWYINRKFVSYQQIKNAIKART